MAMLLEPVEERHMEGWQKCQPTPREPGSAQKEVGMEEAQGAEDNAEVGHVVHYRRQDHDVTWMPGEAAEIRRRWTGRWSEQQEQQARRLDGVEEEAPGCEVQLLDLDAGYDQDLEDGEQMVLIDSGAFDHACPPSFAPSVQIIPPKVDVRVATASDKEVLKILGTKTARMRVKGALVDCTFQVLDIRRPLMSVSALMRHGFCVVFGGKEDAYVKKGKCRLPLCHEGNHFYLRAKVLGEPPNAALFKWSGFQGQERENSKLSPTTKTTMPLTTITNRAEETRGLPDPSPQEVEAQNMAMGPRESPESGSQETWPRNRAERPQEPQPMSQDAAAQWHLFEWCCSADSSPWFGSHGQEATRFGLPNWDCGKRAKTVEAVRLITQALNAGQKVLVWAALPCSPWGPWQFVNLTRGQFTANRTRRARAESRRLLRELTVALTLLAHRASTGVQSLYMAFEWLRGAAAWDSRPLRTLQRLVPYKCEFDGCQYGLRTQDNVCLKKPWRVQTNCS